MRSCRPNELSVQTEQSISTIHELDLKIKHFATNKQSCRTSVQTVQTKQIQNTIA